MLHSLASTEDVADIINVYYEYFDNEDHDLDVTPAAEEAFLHPLLPDSQIDFSMENEASMSCSALLSALGLKEGRFPLFNSFRYLSGTTTPWDNQSVFNVSKNEIPSYLSVLGLHWHQLAGIHSIVCTIFTAIEDSSHPCGVLIGDEVGLGKTAQAIGVIAFLNMVIFLQSEQKPLPPVLSECSVSLLLVFD